MRYEVRQQDGKWLVWDTVVDDCAMKSVVGAVDGLRSIITSNNTRYMLNGGLLVPMPNSVTFETRPAMFWTQQEAHNGLMLGMTLINRVLFDLSASFVA